VEASTTTDPSSPEAPAPRSGSSLRRRLVFSLVPVVVVFGGGELLVRLLDWPSAWESTPFEHNEPFWQTDPELVSDTFPHREQSTEFSVSTDANGLRAPIHQQGKPAGAFRLLFLGCSTTFGWGVDNAQSYPAQVEKLLHEQGFHQVEVINGGQPGHSSFQGMWLYKNVGRDYHADVVVFSYVVQDARKAAYTDRSQALLQQDARFLKQNLLYRSRLYLGLRTFIDSKRMTAKEREEEGTEGVYRVSREEYVEAIREFVALTEADGAQPVLFDFPLERSGYTREHRRLMRIAGEELNIPHMQMQQEFEQLSTQQTLYFPKDRGHANAQGNLLIAQRLATFMRERNLLPTATGDK